MSEENAVHGWPALPLGVIAVVDTLEEASLLVGPDGLVLHANPAAVRRWGPLDPGLPGPDLAAALDADVDELGQLATGAGERGMPAPFALARLEGSAAPIAGVPGTVLLRFRASGTGAPRSAAVAELAARVELLADASRRRQHDLERAEALHGRIISAMHDGLVVQDRDGVIVAANPAACEALGIPEDALLGRASTALDIDVVDEAGDPVGGDGHPTLRTLRTGKPEKDVRLGIRRADGSTRWLDVSTTLLPEGRGVFASFVDVTEVLERDRELTVVRERFRVAFQDAPSGVAVVGLDGRWQQVNPALCELLGRPERQLLATDFQSITHPADLDADLALIEDVLAGRRRSYVMEKRYVRGDRHEPIWVQLAVSLVRDDQGKPNCFVVHIQDISERRTHESELRHLADHDGLTGLVNRRRFADELGRELQRLRRGGAPGALLMLDLDHFKHVNDSFGHKIGDDVICAVADVLRRRLRTSDVVARLGGDEFAVLLPDTEAAAAERVADDLVGRIRALAVPSGEQEVRITASAGVVELDARSQGPSDDLVLADLAMYEAKAAGRDRTAGARPDLAPQP